MKYREFLETKSNLSGQFGFEPLWMPEFLFDFQSHLVEWALLKGRAAIFADCGLGKTPMQLVWAENVHRHTNKPVLIATPLAVAGQTVREGAKFDIECKRSTDGTVSSPIVVTNYERLHHFNPHDFSGMVCDESSILKNFSGTRRGEITEFMKKMKYRLLCTATAAPNDYVELGTSSEALGELGYMDMLGRFFKNDLGTTQESGFGTHSAKWRFKRHAVIPFWRWVCSWARSIKTPSDLGFDDGQFILPQLKVSETVIEARRPRDGMLFQMPAVGLQEQREERRITIEERSEAVFDIVRDSGKPAVVWCHLNAEGDYLENLIPDARQISGSQKDELKEELFEAFATGELRVLVTKPKIAGFGLNWQHCSQMTFFPSHSFEQYYQGVRRCWRFGQTEPVKVDIITTEGERAIMSNLQRKAAAAEEMFARIVAQMHDALTITKENGMNTRTEVPSWL